ncbi:phosphoribosyl-AMP cyclohydrolase [Paraphotobacterium marinum]|uniref:phosphoribosyl-AMP cyclohydrolase n=1 Tax=Paraphotobacterium marinum TaxID=1755811 RepID=UPI0021F352E0|nr:phosphoribosyl-AMP cyclohydrolase [Paraphotobacterium marinum]
MKIEKIMNFNINDINWKKVQNLIPCIIQDDNDGTVLMHGYMNVEALKVSIQTEKVTFYSRTKKDYGLRENHLKTILILIKFYWIVIMTPYSF